MSTWLNVLLKQELAFWLCCASMKSNIWEFVISVYHLPEHGHLNICRTIEHFVKFNPGKFKWTNLAYINSSCAVCTVYIVFEILSMKQTSKTIFCYIQFYSIFQTIFHLAMNYEWFSGVALFSVFKILWSITPGPLKLCVFSLIWVSQIRKWMK